MVSTKQTSHNNTLSKSSPEYSYYHKVKAFFEEDPDFEVSEARNYKFSITVHNRRKFDILNKVLHVPDKLTRLEVTLLCDDDGDENPVSEEDLAYMLENNPYFSHYVESENENGLIPSGLMRFVLMKPTVVQYYDDIFNNPYGYDTKTAEQIAKELFHGSHLNITSNATDDPE